MRYTIAEGVLCQEFPDEAIVLSLDSAEYFRLNSTSLLIWRMLRTGTGRDAIEAALLNDFDASAERVRGEVDAFLGRLVQLGLIREVT
ncbi:MAG TPA: PqqD family protein [Gemmataceae bacterium]|nr:PqqD family protein [Gemmataceae bacterium]